MAIGLVLSIEGLNTAVEKTCFIHPVMKKSVYKIYCCRSSFAANAIIIGLIIYIQNFIICCSRMAKTTKKRTDKKINSKTKQVLGNNKTAQNRFGQPSYIIFGPWFISFTSTGKRDQSAVARLTDRTKPFKTGWVSLGPFLRT
jgi:hypothetical protein